MKWKWLIIIMFVMFTITRNTEERNSPFTLFLILLERGLMAWIELFALTAAIVLPSFFIAKVVDRVTANFYPQLSTWKSFFLAVFSTVACYFVIMALLEPIKNV